MKKNNFRRLVGFTLIELVVVIGIVSAMSATAINSFGETEKTIAITSLKYDLRQALVKLQLAKSKGVDLYGRYLEIKDIPDSSKAQNTNLVDLDIDEGEASHVVITFEVSPNNSIYFENSETEGAICEDGTDMFGLTIVNYKPETKRSLTISTTSCDLNKLEYTVQAAAVVPPKTVPGKGKGDKDAGGKGGKDAGDKDAGVPDNELESLGLLDEDEDEDEDNVDGQATYDEGD